MALPVIPLAPVTKATFPLAGAMIVNVYAYDSLIGEMLESLDRTIKVYVGKCKSTFYL